MNNVDSVWDFFLLMLWFFFLVIWIMILFSVISDLFRDKNESGVKKFFWCLFLIFLPFITVLIYVIVRGKGMAERNVERAKEQQAQLADYVKSVGGGANDPAAQIANAKQLLDSGAIDQGEFDKLKAKALA